MTKTPVLILILMILLSGCASETIPASDVNTIQSMLLHPNCTTPCWAGIQVAITEFDKAKNVLKNRYGFDHVTVEQNYLDWGNGNNPIDGVKAGSILFGKDKVSEIFLVFDEKSNFSVKNLIGILGNPAWVDVSWGGPVELEKPCLGITLQYPSKGIMVSLDPSNKRKGVFENQLVSMLRITAIPDSDQFLVYDFVIVEWQGYKDYCQSIIESLP